MWPFTRRKNQLIRSLGKDHPHTPDIIQLERGPFHLLFIYDDLKVAHRSHTIIKDKGTRVGRGFTQDVFDFRIGKFTGKAVPFMSKEGLRVKGELYAVGSQHIPALDNHYKNGVEFARVRLNIMVTDRDHQLLSIGNEKFLAELPPGAIRTVPELGVRHYTSYPQTCLIGASMYVAMKSFWNEEDFSVLRRPAPVFPKEETIWLPKYYTYPIEVNRK